MKKYVSILLFFIIEGFFVPSRCLTLEKINIRPKTNNIPKCIQYKIDTTNIINIYDIINISCNYTAEYLEFTKKNDIDEGKANCVGYAQLCSAIANELISKSNFSASCNPVVGYIYYNQMNLCKLLKTIVPTRYEDFVKDHDFVELSYQDSIYYYDPSMYDYIGDMCMTVKSKSK